MESATLEGTEHRPPWSNASTPSAILAASVGFKKLRSIGAMSYSQARWMAVASTSVARRLPSKSCKRSRQILLPNVRFWPKADMPKNAIDVAVGGNADMTLEGLHVCF